VLRVKDFITHVSCLFFILFILNSVCQLALVANKFCPMLQFDECQAQSNLIFFLKFLNIRNKFNSWCFVYAENICLIFIVTC
jgi:hypothetical protein